MSSTASVGPSVLLWNEARQAPPRKPTTPLWTLTKDGRTWSAELCGHGEWGWELQIFRDGAFRYGHRHPLHALAVAEANHRRAELEVNGWTSGDA